MARFVILRHETPPGSARPLHWDLMLESDNHLLSWALVSEPAPDCEVACEPLPNHRRAYLDFEGPISGNRGVVTRCDYGTFTWQKNEAARVVVVLRGQRSESLLTIEKNSVAGVWFARFQQRSTMHHERPVS